MGSFFSRMTEMPNKDFCHQMPIYKGFLYDNKPSYFAYFLFFVEWSRIRSECKIFAIWLSTDLGLVNFKVSLC